MSVFRYSHRVTYADCTIGDHIYYSRYLELLEAARGEFFRQLGTTLLQWQERDVTFPVLECRLRYRAPARYDDLLTIEVWPLSAQGARLTFRYQILNQEGQLLVEGETWHACASVAGKPKRLPGELLPCLQPWLGVTLV